MTSKWIVFVWVIVSLVLTAVLLAANSSEWTREFISDPSRGMRP